MTTYTSQPISQQISSTSTITGEGIVNAIRTNLPAVRRALVLNGLNYTPSDIDGRGAVERYAPNPVEIIPGDRNTTSGEQHIVTVRTAMHGGRTGTLRYLVQADELGFESLTLR